MCKRLKFVVCNYNGANHNINSQSFVKSRQAVAAQRGTCPFPMALSLSTLEAIPSTTLSTLGSVSHHCADPILVPQGCPCPCPSRHGESLGLWAFPTFALSDSVGQTLPGSWCNAFPPMLLGCCGLHPLYCLWVLEQATIQILSRLCFAPMSAADTTPHRLSYPIAVRSARTRSSPLVTSIGLFSTNANWGRTSPIIRAISRHIPDRSPSSPSPFPAIEMS